MLLKQLLGETNSIILIVLLRSLSEVLTSSNCENGAMLSASQQFNNN